MTKQYILIDEYGSKFHYKDKKMTKRHREDGPAVERANGGNEWYINGERHREDGPAAEYANGNKSWYINGKLHREDGPAVEYTSGAKVWYVNGKLHREDGPAIERADGYRAWYVNGVYLTEEQFNARNAPVELTLEDIAAKFNVDVSKLKIIK